MPRQHTRSYEEKLISSVVESINADADQIASEHGAPAGQQERSQAERVRLWGRNDPTVDYGSYVSQLLTTGIPPEQLQQTQLARVLGHRYPELLAAYTQPVQDAALANQLAKIAEYPFRLPLYDHLPPKDRVTEAQRLDREWQKTLAAPMVAPAAVSPGQGYPSAPGIQVPEGEGY